VGIEVEAGTVDGQPAALLRRHGALEVVVMINASDDGIERIHWLMNPHKLAALS